MIDIEERLTQHLSQRAAGATARSDLDGVTTARTVVTLRRVAPPRFPTRRRVIALAAAAVALVAGGLGLLPGLWFALAWWAWSTGLRALAVSPGLFGVLALVVVGLLALRAAARPDDS